MLLLFIVWATSTLNAENVAVPFLPANPFLSATRNQVCFTILCFPFQISLYSVTSSFIVLLQGRQKLARFSRAEFAGLLTDVLIDARRRQNMANLRPMDANSSSFYNPSTITTTTTTALYNNDYEPNFSDEEPIYDPVASDDDYAPVAPIAQQVNFMRQKILKLNNSFG